LRTAEGFRRLPGMVRDGGGLPGTAREQSHEVKRIRLEVYDLNLASTGGPIGRTIVPYSPSCPHLPERSPSQHPQKDRLCAVVDRVLTGRRMDWTIQNTGLSQIPLSHLKLYRYITVLRNITIDNPRRHLHIFCPVSNLSLLQSLVSSNTNLESRQKL